MRIFCIILASCLFLGTNIASVSAQSLEDLKSRIDGGDSKAVIEFAISAGAEGMPYLRTLLQRGEPQHRWGTTSGYAMAALAKLGDRAALDQIKGELSAKVTVYDAIAKLKFVGGHTAAGLLVDAFRHPELYEAMIQHEQDYTDDPLLDICKALIEVVPDPPISPSDPCFPHRGATWLAWWDTNSDKVPDSIALYGLSDPTDVRLVRRIEWHQASAVLELGHVAGDRALPFLESLTHYHVWTHDVRPIDQPIGSIPGNAQIVAAEMGDVKSFTAITRELSSSWPDAIKKLEYIRNRQAVDAIIAALDEKDLPAKTGNDSYDKWEYDSSKPAALMAALSNMLANPPSFPATSPPSVRIQSWRSWWTANRDATQFRKRSSVSIN
jgi:hypothetical protein